MYFVALFAFGDVATNLIMGSFHDRFWNSLWMFIAALALLGFLDIFSDVEKHLKRLADAAVANQPPPQPPAR